MGLFRKKEVRAAEVEIEDPLLKALLNGGEVTREMALQVPTVSGGIDLIANIVSGTPIKLYRDEGGKTVEIRDDPRLRLLNDETGDTLNANEFWKAIIRDYYLGRGGYAYIHREQGKIKSLHYVEESQISIQKNADPIFKDFDILVQGRTYHPFDFLKILRNTKDGAQGTPIIIENSKIIEAAYAAIVFERNLVKRGGNKKGFLKSEKRLDQPALDSLKVAFARLYGNDSDASENFVLLNSGIDFKESSNTSVEMQLNENKVTNAEEFAKIFHVQTAVISGSANESDISSLARLAAIPLMVTIQCALNKDFLLEKEKSSYYYAFDTKELLRGDMASRFSAYKTALDANFMQIDEVRYAEDMEPLGLSWIKLGLQDVLYDPKTQEIFTPNTGMGQQLGQGSETTNLDISDQKSKEITAEDAQQAAKEVVNKTLNGAQTQSLIAIVQNYQTGVLTLSQAVNIISVSIGVSKEEAAELIGETSLNSAPEDDNMEERGRYYKRDSKGLFASTGSGK